LALHFLGIPAFPFREVSLEWEESRLKEQRRVDEVIVANLLVAQVYHLSAWSLYTFMMTDFVVTSCTMVM
jgi:hypothetical protein